MADALPEMNGRGVAIIGGGPGGSALAALLARPGRRVVLVDKDVFPRDKLCGEFLSTEAQSLLARVGCLDRVLALSPARIRRARFFAPSGRAVELELPGTALGLSRAALDELLLRHAARRGAEILEGTRAVSVRRERDVLAVETDGAGPLRADLVIGAYGRLSALHAALGRKPSPALFVGLKRHHAPAGAAGERLRAELAGTVELHAFQDGYGGVSFVEGGLVNVCVLLRAKRLASFSPPRWEGLLAALPRLSPSLAARLRALAPAEPAVHAAGGVSFETRGAAVPGLLFLGDAAGMIAPLCGDGQAMALRSAVMLAQALERGSVSGADWDRTWRREFGARMRLGRLLQACLLRPASCEAALRLARAWPRLASALVRATRGAQCQDAP